MYHVTKNCYYGLVNSKGLFEIAWGIGMDNSSGDRIYKISYKVKDAVSKNPDCYELYWQFVGEDFEISADKITGTIKLPQTAKTKDDVKIWGHTEDLNGEISATTNTVKFNLDDFRSGRYVEVRVAMPQYFSIYTGRTANRTVQQIIDEETLWAKEANERREFAKGITNFLGFLVIIISGVCIIFLVKNIKKKSKILNETEKFTPTQKMQYYRDIPDENTSPGEALMLLKQSAVDFSGTEIGKLFSAILLNLSLKRMIEFEVQKDKNGKDNILIKMNYDDSNGITSADDKGVYEFLLKATRGKNGQISLKELEKYIKKHSTDVVVLKKKIDNQAKNEIIAKAQANKEEMKHKEKSQTSIVLYLFGLVYAIVFGNIFGIFNPISFIGTIPLIICLIVGMVKTSKIAKNVNVFSQSGVDEGEKWQALKRFMNDFSTMDRKEIPEIVLWEKYLVYATAFGMADKVVEQLKVVYPDFETNSNFNGNVYMSHMMYHNFSSSMSHSVSSAMSSAYSSGSGGGGGFSGGGGGGRRPEVAAVAVKC